MSEPNVPDSANGRELGIDLTPQGVATITLNRPQVKNALSMQLISMLQQSISDLAVNDDVRVVVLKGADPVFCAGGDLQWMRSVIEQGDSEKRADALALGNLLDTLYRMPKPVIACVQGGAYGGGIGLMAIADIVIATSDAKFALAEVRLGVIPATIAPYVTERIGMARARSLMVTGRLVGATEAQTLGLVDMVCDHDQLEPLLNRQIDHALAASPGSSQAVKQLLASMTATQPAEHLPECVDALVDVWNGHEATEGLAAFLERRPASWAVKTPKEQHAEN